ncbi:MAG TPA: alpha/beta hydrolase-fold protein [Gemmatimonadaceae bacterium]|nr:alpha/beta hydrolase-fold protein [Gemmatimonadaceae bacterium]
MRAQVLSSAGALAMRCIVAAALHAPFALAQQATAPGPTAMPRALETSFALSAVPPYLRDSAGVYVLDPARGYVEARAGTNGFRCLVLRTEWTRPELPFRDDIFVPMCWDAAGAAALLPVDLDVAAMRARGDSPRAVYDEIMRRYADGRYHAPARAGLAYMLGPVMRTFIADTSPEPTTMIGPHFMFYAPNVTDADIGGRQQSEGPFMLSTGPHGLIFLGAGASRTQEILAQSRSLIADLCAYRSVLCIPKKRAAQPTASLPRDTLVVDSQILHEPRLINVYLPNAYRDATRRLAVLYMPDGGMDEDFPHVVRAVDALVARKAIPPTIVVGIPNTQRRRDLTGPTRVASDSAIAPQVGGSASFRSFIRDELIPVIDRRYRTTSQRAIVGESLAGLFVVDTFLHDAALFDRYVAFDPSLWWNRGALVDSTASLLAAVPKSTGPERLFVASSRDDIDSETTRFAGVLRRSAPPRLDWKFEPHPELTHATIFAALESAGLEFALR